MRAVAISLGLVLLAGCGVSGPGQPLTFGQGSGQEDDGGGDDQVESSSSGATTGGTSGAGGSTGTTTSASGGPNTTPSSGSGGPPPTTGSGGSQFCQEDPNDDACSACAKEACCPEITACIALPACVDWLLCLQTGGDIATCFGENGAPPAELTDLGACTEDSGCPCQ